MKKNQLLPLLFLLLGTNVLFAQSSEEKKVPITDRIFIIGYQDENTPLHVQRFRETMRKGFREAQPPHFIIMGKEHKFMLGIGGFVNFRMGYDFDNVIQNTDFVTYDVPVYPTAAMHQRFLMDASTSRLFFRFLTNTSKFNGFEAYLEMDFRGKSNVLRLRKAYISYMGFLFGQDVTTFCDLTASPNTIDFEGPNAYTYGRNLMIRYSHRFKNNISLGVAAELPGLSATYTPNELAIAQRVPDFPMYIQYNWGKNDSHIRASAIFRDLYYYSNTLVQDRSRFGWGVQLSGNIFVTPKLQTYFQGVYGEGITPYIQDIAGVGLDLVPNPKAHGIMQTLPMMGWFAGLGYNFTPAISASVTYSAVELFKHNDYYQPNLYKKAQYLVANAFWNVTPSIQVGVEYLYGTRTNMNSDKGHANRVQAMVQFNF